MVAISIPGEIFTSEDSYTIWAAISVAQALAPFAQMGNADKNGPATEVNVGIVEA
ncbi:hypothetical protein VB780_07675 [Leptolyngbya sp. CCNP1308]|uniref:hypothetical protein n=1 Tax=Leptolyngbya sp. CCNP1308 TaxID=3110255 RepID=UPI002B1FACBE|nr:hypothetical protein [Leptolyngbya sp. CCNP1308]MEA5448441.1 hypothetical protein [Leptolyngbya sp. CCNP1308]